MKANNLHEHLTTFFTKYLQMERGVSRNTIDTYKLTFLLLIRFFETVKQIKVNKLAACHITKDNIVDFLNWLQEKRKCGNLTRNNRLAAIRSFCKYLQYQELDNLYECQKILSIRQKKTSQKVISYLTIEGIELLLKQPNTSTRNGRRDLVLLMFTYETGARVQEVIDFAPLNLTFSSTSTVILKGKGNKERCVPVSKTLAKYLQSYMNENELSYKSLNSMFFNKYGAKLTRGGMAYILAKYGDMAKQIKPSLIPNDLHCHCLRHSRAMCLLNEGFPLVYIRDYLGHVSITTTEIYARIDSKQKKEALEKISGLEVNIGKKSWQKDNNLMKMLKNL